MESFLGLVRDRVLSDINRDRLERSFLNSDLPLCISNRAGCFTDDRTVFFEEPVADRLVFGFISLISFISFISRLDQSMIRSCEFASRFFPFTIVFSKLLISLTCSCKASKKGKKVNECNRLVYLNIKKRTDLMIIIINYVN